MAEGSRAAGMTGGTRHGRWGSPLRSGSFARALPGGGPRAIPAEVIGFSHAFIGPMPAEQIRNPRIPATEKPAPVGATSSEAFIAWTGRVRDWNAPR